MQKAVVILVSNKEIYFDESVSINHNKYVDNCDRDLIEFACDMMINDKTLIDLSNKEGRYIFHSDKILCLKQYKEI